MGEFASKGVAGSGLGLGIAGTALGLLNANGNGGGLLGGLFGGGNCQNAQAGMALNALAEKDAKIAELTAMRYSDNQDAAVYKQTLADNKTLRDEMYAYITPIAQESAANRERVAVLEAQQKCEAEKAQLREQIITQKIDRVVTNRWPQQSGHRGRLSQGSCQRHHEGGRAAWRNLPAADAPLQRVDVSRRRDSGDGLQSRPNDGAAVTGRSAS